MGAFFFFFLRCARTFSERSPGFRASARARSGACLSGCGNLVWVVCLVASPVVGLLSEARARGHPPGVDIARHVPVKRLKTALKQNPEPISLIKMPCSGSCEVCRHRRKGLGRHWMGPCGSARRSRSVLSGSTLVPYHVSTDLTTVARARARAQLRRDGSPARPSLSRQLPRPGIDVAMRAARSADGSAFPRCVCRCPPRR